MAWLTDRGRTQLWLAAELNVAPAVLWRWIVGDRTPRIEALVRIEDLTGIPAREWAAESPAGTPAPTGTEA